MGRLFLLIGLVCAHATPTCASGSGIVRDLESTSFRACPTGGKLMEHYFVTGDAQGYAEYIEIACLGSRTSAVWVFYSSTDCTPTPRRTSRECHDLAHPREHLAEVDKSSSPRLVTYEVVGYEIAEDCHIAKDKDVAELVWSCRRTRAHPKVQMRVKAVGPENVLADIAPGAAQLPLAFRPIPK